MFWFMREGDPDWMLMGAFLSLMTGLLCGGGTLAVGLVRGHRSLGWTGFGVSILVGLGCFLVGVVPAAGFIAIMLLTEPIEKSRRRKRSARALADLDYTSSYGTGSTRDRQAESKGPSPKPRPPRAVDDAP